MIIYTKNELIESDIVDKLMKKMFRGAGGNGYKDFLHHVNKDKPRYKNVLKLDEPKVRVKIFTKESRYKNSLFSIFVYLLYLVNNYSFQRKQR